MTVGESIRDSLATLRAYKGRSILQMIGVTFGVAAVIVTLSLVEGGKEQGLDYLDETGGLAKLDVRKKTTGRVSLHARETASYGLTYEDAVAVRDDMAEETDAVSPVLHQRLLLRKGAKKSRRSVVGVAQDYQTLESFFVEHGRFITYADLAAFHKVIVLGTEVRDELFGSDVPLGQDVIVGTERYRVIGVMEEKSYRFNDMHDNMLEWMNRQAFIPVTTALKRMTGGREITDLNVLASDVEAMPETRDRLEQLLSRRHRGAIDFEVIDRGELLAEREAEGMVYDIAFGVSGAISLLVGGIIIMNILLASLRQRIQEVGVRKALGATDFSIFGQFLIESVLIAGGGAVLGTFLGTNLTGIVSDLMQQSTMISPGIVGIAVGSAITVGLIFGLYPAIKAARLHPVESLRYE